MKFILGYGTYQSDEPLEIVVASPKIEVEDSPAPLSEFLTP